MRSRTKSSFTLLFAKETDMTQRLREISDDEAGLVKGIFDSSNQLLGRTANFVRTVTRRPA